MRNRMKLTFLVIEGFKKLVKKEGDFIERLQINIILKLIYETSLVFRFFFSTYITLSAASIMSSGVLWT